MAQKIGANGLHAISQELEEDIAAQRHPSLEQFQTAMAQTVEHAAALGESLAPPTRLTATSPLTILHEIRSAVETSRFLAPDLVQTLR